MKSITNLAKASLATLVLVGGACAFDLRAQDENLIIQNRNSSFYDNPLSRTYTGRAPFNNTLRPAPEPAPAAAPRRAPAPPPPSFSSAETCWGLVRLTKKAPAAASVGETIAYELVASAQCDVADVIITDTVSAAASYVKSEPEGTVDGNRLIWKMPSMRRGETKTILVWLKAEKEGELINCATVIAVPQTCVSTMIGKAALSIVKTGPETAQLGTDVTYTIVVKNSGTSAAKNVVVKDTVPEGLTHASGQKELSFNAGDLAPNQSKSFPVVLKAAQRGKFCNIAVATSSNAGQAKAEACTTIVKPGLKVVKTGDKAQITGRNASYQIVVSNIGDTTLNDVVVTDTAPAQTAIVTATGATVNGNQAVWNVREIKAGEQKTFDVKLTSKISGTHCNTVTASSGGLKESSEACTVWRGVAGVLLEVVDDPDPIQVGETSTYTIRVTNQGFADMTNIDIVANFPKEVTPVTTQGGTVNGQTVNFPRVARLASKQSFTYTVVAKGAVVGDARVKVAMTAAELNSPVTEEESTTVY